MPRYALLTHDHPHLHWDLLLEDGAVCRTWRLMSPLDSQQEIDAEQVFDHRLMYLDYEGPISGDRGTVTQWDCGEFKWRDQQDHRCEVSLLGDRWQGVIRLIRIEGTRWTCLPTPLAHDAH